jgi:hypothetical protein
MILPKIRDPRLITIRRGGQLSDDDHHLLALWAAQCSEHVLHYFENQCPHDNRPRKAIEKIRVWARGEISVTEAKKAAYDANAAARELDGPAKYAALSAGQAAAVAHVAAHDLGAAGYAIRAVMANSEDQDKKKKGMEECEWQRKQVPKHLQEFVMEDQRNRNEICWKVFQIIDR